MVGELARIGLRVLKGLTRTTETALECLAELLRTGEVLFEDLEEYLKKRFPEEEAT